MPNHSDGYVGVAWSEPHIDMKEYIRTDAFIGKACEWLRNYLEITGKELLIEDFKNYMKGE
jgi:hypothetical protein